jgi:hypothetical protein
MVQENAKANNTTEKLKKKKNQIKRINRGKRRKKGIPQGAPRTVTVSFWEVTLKS